MFYRVKIKNKIVRLSKERIENLLEQGKLESTDYISWDGLNWVPAVNAPKPLVDFHPTHPLPAIPDEPEEQEWFYSKDGRCSNGPCSKHEIIDIILQGLLDDKTLLWKKEEKESILLSNHPVFRDYYEGVRGLMITKKETAPVLKEETLLKKSLCSKIFDILFKKN